ncbi:MAG TPA: hypothetical protein VNK43_07945 [Gemmatimonadales bacterium]|nr:hypothetical protein [Gemmatimonadales bacterium]
MTNDEARIARPLAALLVLGTLIVAAAGLVHPRLMGGGARQLATIAASPHWRAVHLGLLAGTGLVIAGIWSQAFRYPRDAGGELLRVGLAVVSIGLAIHALNIVYMTGAGHAMAGFHAAGDGGMATLFDATHPIGLMAARFGNYLIAIGAMLLGWASTRAGVDPPWVGGLAWLAGVGGLVAVALAHESTQYILAPAALLIGWQLAAGGRTLLARRSRPAA